MTNWSFVDPEFPLVDSPRCRVNEMATLGGLGARMTGPLTGIDHISGREAEGTNRLGGRFAQPRSRFLIRRDGMAAMGFPRPSQNSRTIGDE